MLKEDKIEAVHDLIKQVRDGLADMRMAVEERSPTDRHLAILSTDMEKVEAQYIIWIKE